jgi:hypothetical protein
MSRTWCLTYSLGSARWAPHPIVADEEAFGRVTHYPVGGKQSEITGRWNHVAAGNARSVALDLAFRLVGSEKQLQHYWAWREQVAMDPTAVVAPGGILDE